MRYGAERTTAMWCQAPVGTVSVRIISGSRCGPDVIAKCVPPCIVDGFQPVGEKYIQTDGPALKSKRRFHIAETLRFIQHATEIDWRVATTPAGSWTYWCCVPSSESERPRCPT